MSTKKPFVVKHGLEVADNLIFAESQKVGIQTAVPEYNLDVKGDVALTGKLLVTDETGATVGPEAEKLGLKPNK